VQHYLVAEYFMTSPVSMTPEVFYSKTKQEQADLVWKHLFVDRTPISEACRGVGMSYELFLLLRHSTALLLVLNRSKY